MQLDAMGHPPYGMGAGRQLGAVECSPMARTQTLLAAPQDWSHTTGCWGLSRALAGWCGAQPHSDESVLWGLGFSPTVDGCCRAPGSAPAGAVGWPGLPRAPMEFPASWLLRSLIKT